MPKLAKLLTSTVIAATLATVGSAADNSSAEAFAARLANFGSGNIEGLLAQYADDATIISPMGVIDTAEGRRGMIEGIIGEFVGSHHDLRPGDLSFQPTHPRHADQASIEQNHSVPHETCPVGHSKTVQIALSCP